MAPILSVPTIIYGAAKLQGASRKQQAQLTSSQVGGKPARKYLVGVGARPQVFCCLRQYVALTKQNCNS